MGIDEYSFSIDAPIQSSHPSPDNHDVLLVPWIEVPPGSIRDVCVHYGFVAAIVVYGGLPAKLRQLPCEIYYRFLGATKSLSPGVPCKPIIFTIHDEVLSRGRPLAPSYEMF